MQMMMQDNPIQPLKEFLSKNVTDYFYLYILDGYEYIRQIFLYVEFSNEILLSRIMLSYILFMHWLRFFNHISSL